MATDFTILSYIGIYSKYSLENEGAAVSSLTSSLSIVLKGCRQV